MAALPSWAWPEARWRKAVTQVRAGRSLKPARWKDGARVAVALSFDSDHESWELRDGAQSIGRLSQGEYGARAAMPRILALLRKHGVPATFFVPAVIALLYPDEQRRVVAEGHEVGIHGWIHERSSGLTPAQERDLTLRSAEVLARVTGVQPAGMRTASWDFTAHTLPIERELGLLYDSSLMADDDPYELLQDGEATGIVELPVEWIRDDAVYFNMRMDTALRPYASPRAVFDLWRAEFDLAREEGGLFLLTMHPHVTGHRSRIALLDEFIAALRAHPDVWFATHEQVARYVKAPA